MITWIGRILGIISKANKAINIAERVIDAGTQIAAKPEEKNFAPVENLTSDAVIVDAPKAPRKPSAKKKSLQ